MSNRWFRFGIALLALGAAVAAGYRIFEQEQSRTTGIAVAQATDVAAETALTTVAELKAALHAYVAEGQGEAFWTARAATLIDRLRDSLLALDAPASAAGVPLTEPLDLTDRLSAAEKRARDHVRQGEQLLAGEVIFIEARDLLDAIRLQVARARTTMSQAATQSEASIRREEAMLAVGALGVLAFATLLLVIPGRVEPRALTGPETKSASAPADDYLSSARMISRPSAPSMPTRAAAAQARPATARATREAAPAVSGAPGEAAASPAAGANSGERREELVEVPSPRQSVPSTSATASPSGDLTVNLREAAAVCTDLGRVSQSIEITGLLDRAAKVLNASGVVVWLASTDGQELYPAASAGYDDRLFARIGAIPRSASNVTAASLRDATPRTNSRFGQSAAALAVPLMSPLGPVGVLSAEIQEVADVDEARMSVAMIFAAQLATILGSMATMAASPSAATENEASQAAKASR